MYDIIFDKKALEFLNKLDNKTKDREEIINIIITIIIITTFKVDIMGNTTISIANETKDALLKLGSKGETYDSIIKKLIKRFAWKKIDDNWNQILANDEFIPLEEL